MAFSLEFGTVMGHDFPWENHTYVICAISLPPDGNYPHGADDSERDTWSLKSAQKLLVANRGEIAVRILRTAKRLGIRTVSICTQSDATAPHVALADESVALRPDDDDPPTNSRRYLDAAHIADICVSHNVTLVHPGYGFLSENHEFAALIESQGITWVGPTSQTIQAMGLKHVARSVAIAAGVPVVPGSEGLVHDLVEAKSNAQRIGYPLMLKSTAGGGGMGLIVCRNEEDLTVKFLETQERAKSLFHNDGLFLERYFPKARHIEIQVFGNGQDHLLHMGERECSVQRRYQKVIEESPSPFLIHYPGLREKMCDAATRMCKNMRYSSAGKPLPQMYLPMNISLHAF
ncbi:hypothetical protein NM688_g9128 [Phlebia brevispora]|uniref:Uncharacterized protein n=1 Tax=Phlebia brevispora TaxID=194682 RepID=A0ACC1RMP2_9APHY|nr:hypothetical protein NM688_g9128 [Phlebia brevispora]